jgi:diguanylate cyclase (GGDEF)-like protein
MSPGQEPCVLDEPTLLAVTTLVTLVLGIFLLAAWVQERTIRALAWWGTAYIVGASAVTLWGVQGASPILPPWAPNALLFLACGLVWTGARLFHGKRPRPVEMSVGALVWLAAMHTPAFAASDAARVVLSSLVIASYAFLTARELHSDRRRSGAGRRLAVVVPLLHGMVFLSPIPLTMIAPPDASPGGWFVLLALETLLYVVGTAFIVLVMAKERIVTIHKTAAMTDPLTGLFNRRAFFEAADAMIAKQARAKAPVSVLAFDLDHFKSINDRFGHAAGDDALRAFARTAGSTMRATDVLGRIGGEEFVAIIPGSTSESIMAAERVRAAYEIAGREIAGHVMKSTVSIGTASATGPVNVNELLARADGALYRAKENGRNRVEPAEPLAAPATPGANPQGGAHKVAHKAGAPAPVPL